MSPACELLGPLPDPSPPASLSAIHRENEGEAGDQTRMVRFKRPDPSAPAALSQIHRVTASEAGDQMRMVPLARLERALPKKTDFESVASTNSATGAVSEPLQ